MYKPGLMFERTIAERNDPFLSWKRTDQAFFASGACHILSEMFRQLHVGEDYRVIFIKPANNKPGTHVYITDGTWAFDHNGWTLEKELLKVTRAAYHSKYPGWDYERIIVTDTLELFCSVNHHRQPWQFAHLPWERAYNYIQQFPAKPPKIKTK